MTEQHDPCGDHPLNANLVSFILIINFIVIGGLILANMPPRSLQTNQEAEAVAAPATASRTPMPRCGR